MVRTNYSFENESINSHNVVIVNNSSRNFRKLKNVLEMRIVNYWLFTEPKTDSTSTKFKKHYKVFKSFLIRSQRYFLVLVMLQNKSLESVV